MFKKLILFAVVLLVMAISVFGLCGNKITELSEQCDDGCFEPPSNANICEPADDGDGCDQYCQIESGWTCDNSIPSACTLLPSLDISVEAYDLDGNWRTSYHEGEIFEVRIYVKVSENLYGVMLSVVADNENINFLTTGNNGEIYSLPTGMYFKDVKTWIFKKSIGNVLKETDPNLQKKLLFSIDAEAKTGGDGGYTSKIDVPYGSAHFYADPNSITEYNTQVMGLTITVKEPASCSDGIKNQGESDEDCGGVISSSADADGIASSSTVCPPCEADKSCKLQSDCIDSCINSVCTKIDSADLVLCEDVSGLEPVKDKTLVTGVVNVLKTQTCAANTDCASNSCENNVCESNPLQKIMSILALLKTWYGLI